MYHLSAYLHNINPRFILSCSFSCTACSYDVPYIVLLLTSASLDQAPPDEKKALYLQYAKLEEDYGLAKRAMNVYDEAVRAVPNSQKMSMYEIYIARAAELFGVPRTRQIYEVSSLSRLSYAFPFVLYSLLLDRH
jgi:hypothetical protein